MEVKLETLKRVEALSSSFDLAEGLEEDMVRSSVGAEVLGTALCVIVEAGLVRTLSIVFKLG